MKASALLRLMRPRQWTKNVFVLAPLVFGFKLMDMASVSASLTATFVFGLVASLVYIVNDMRDMDADRVHPKKCLRPLASGEVTRPEAAGLMMVLAILVMVVAHYALFDRMFWIFLGIYGALSLGYSLGLKQIPLLELFIVAAGYVLRVLAGCAAIAETPSPWILAAGGTVALLIVAGKRRAEIAENNDPEQLRRSLREYNLSFLDSMITMLAANSVVTYLLFTTSDYALERYHTPYLVATSVFVLYGILRYMQLIKVTTGADDPTNLILTDSSLRIAVLGWVATCVGLIYF